MGFISDQINKPGPGVEKDAPPKKGFMRFCEIVARDYVDMIRVNLFTLLSLVPASIFAAMYFMGEIKSIWLLVIAWLLAIPAAPAIAAQFKIILKMIRDIPGFVWHDFKSTYKESFFQSSAFFAVIMPLLGILCYAMYSGIFAQEPASIWLLCCLFLALITLVTIFLFTFAQIALVKLPLGTILKNSFILLIGRANRALPALFITLLVIALTVLFFPYSGIVVLLGLPAFTLLVVCMWLWPALKLVAADKTELENEQAAADEQLINDYADNESDNQNSSDNL